MINKLVSIILTVLCNGQAISDTTIPDSIDVPTASKLQLSLHAKGDQIYVCTTEAGAYVWKWQAPDAKLYAILNHSLVGVHGAGPSWTYKDGSTVKAKFIKKVDAPEKSSVPWLLLEATNHQGNGVLAQTRYIQRINTQGGISPVSGCDANHLGSEKRVAYIADYVFYIK